MTSRRVRLDTEKNLYILRRMAVLYKIPNRVRYGALGTLTSSRILISRTESRTKWTSLAPGLSSD